MHCIKISFNAEIILIEISNYKISQDSSRICSEMHRNLLLHRKHYPEYKVSNNNRYLRYTACMPITVIVFAGYYTVAGVPIRAYALTCVSPAR